MPVSAARKIAYEVLRRVETEGAYASDLLHTELGANIKAEDAGLATEIVLGVLRWRRQLDFLLDRHLKKSVGRLDVPVATALRMGMYQLRFLDRIPARAVVNEAVELVKYARKTSAATLVNAVLRRAAAEAKVPAAQFLPADGIPNDNLGILYSHPTWLVERWLARMGDAETIAMLAAHNRPPRLSCAVHDEARREEILAVLREAALQIAPGVLLKSSFAVSGGSPSRTEAFRNGEISIQDEASQAVPLLLDVQEGHRVLDLCAAPGGKTPALVRGAAKSGMVVAAERHAHRIKAMREQFKRLHLPNVRVVELDAEKPLPFDTQFDRILVDAPCSGTGTFSRHPEIRWRLRPEQLSELHALQCSLLENALEMLAPGGRLVYSTCSMEPEENENVVEEVLQGRKDFSRMASEGYSGALRKRLAPKANTDSLFDHNGYFRTVPHQHQTDGFFAAIIEKVKT